MSINARKSALYILNTLDKGHRTLDSILEDYFGSVSSGSRQDRALIQAPGVRRVTLAQTIGLFNLPFLQYPV